MNRTEREAELAAVDQALRELPPIDPPRALVQRTLDRVAASAARAKRARHLGAMALAIAIVVLTVGVALLVPRASDMSASVDRIALGPSTPAVDPTPEVEPAAAAGRGRFRGANGDEANVDLQQQEWSKNIAGEAVPPEVAELPPRVDEHKPEEPEQALERFGWRGPAAGDAGEDTAREVAGKDRDKGKALRTIALLDDEITLEGALGGQGVDLGGRDAWYRADENGRAGTVVTPPGLFESTSVVSDLERDGKLGLLTRLPEAPVYGEHDAELLRGQLDAQTTTKLDNGLGAGALAQGFDIPRPLAFIPARGWFANTYIPGDGDVVRLDLSRVTSKVGARSQGALPVLEAVRAIAQPFDRPVGQAVSLQLAADRTAVEGPTRLTLQVGLAGAAPVKTRRAPIATALVVDVASTADEGERQTLWSLAGALVAERQAGDALAIVVPRAAGPVVLRGDALDAGELARALAAAAEERHALDDSVLALAYRVVAEARAAATTPANKKGVTLGASTVLVATAGPLAPALVTSFGARAHAEALGDIQLSAVGAGGRVDRGGLATLAQRGQGRRWLAASPADARRVIGDELGSAGRTVARAVRVGIRLAPGVKLVEVVGSHPLAVADRKEAREAEAAIDKQLADRTGIAADRGQDEDGIQIVIPAFMAGDDHTILLDVVVPGPGPVLDVHLRWKDLLRMDNVEAQASLSLPAGKDQATPIALNVVENRAAMVASEALLAAARDVARQQPGAAQPLLSNARRQLDELARRAPTVQEQTRVVDHYEALIREAPAWIQDDAAREEMVRALESTGRMLR